MQASCNLIWVSKAPPHFHYPELIYRKSVVHAVFTRKGGVSPSPYRSLNVGFSLGDKPENVNKNLEIIKEALGAEILVFMDQCHGTEIALITSKTFPEDTAPPCADAVITNLPGRALLVKQADCQAIILFDPENRVLANIHCGWRGNVQNIIGKVVSRMKQDFGSGPSALRAAVGPSLGPCCAEFRDHESIFPPGFSRFMVKDNYFDLWEITRGQLLEAGLRPENMEFARICTRCRRDLFFSYRGEGTTGRFGTVAMLV